jgi:hypothetical protein
MSASAFETRFGMLSPVLADILNGPPLTHDETMANGNDVRDAIRLLGDTINKGSGKSIRWRVVDVQHSVCDPETITCNGHDAKRHACLRHTGSMWCCVHVHHISALEPARLRIQRRRYKDH